MERDMQTIDWLKLGVIIRQHRLDLQLSQAEVAKEVGISQPAISLTERGNPTGLTDERLLLLLSLLDISHDELPIAEQRSAAPLGHRIFISYSHRDREFLGRLQVHLRPLERSGLIDLWVDKRLSAGDHWRAEMQKALEEARAAILLISADFMASDFIIANELPPLLANATKKGTVILPIVLKPCRFTRDKVLAMYQSVNSPDEPLAAMDDHGQELVFDTVARRIEELFAIGS